MTASAVDPIGYPVLPTFTEYSLSEPDYTVVHSAGEESGTTPRRLDPTPMAMAKGIQASHSQNALQRTAESIAWNAFLNECGAFFGFTHPSTAQSLTLDTKEMWDLYD